MSAYGVFKDEVFCNTHIKPDHEEFRGNPKQRLYDKLKGLGKTTDKVGHSL